MFIDKTTFSSHKRKLINSFNPDNPGQLGKGLYGLPFSADESSVVIMPVPWEVTVSYRCGTAAAPAKVLEVSPQLDLYDPEIKDAWQAGIHLLPADPRLVEMNKTFRAVAIDIIETLESGCALSKEQTLSLDALNSACADMNELIRQTASKWLAKNKVVGTLGGDHSTPLGLIRALTEVHDSFGILHIDAHCDLRPAYEGFSYSHASVMYNALTYDQVQSLVQVGIRDYCQQEVDYIAEQNTIHLFTDADIQKHIHMGGNWRQICKDIIQHLPAKVYISLDVDGLHHTLCPATGTPVPGGLEFQQACYLFTELVFSGRQIIGFDISETGDGEWDAIVAARILYKLGTIAVAAVN